MAQHPPIRVGLMGFGQTGRQIFELASRCEDVEVVAIADIGNSHSSIYDVGFSAITADRYLRVLNWYDNEWGYSSRVCDLLARIGSL